MNTTNLFVELLVIGLGPLAALALVVWVVLGADAVTAAEVFGFTSSLGFVIPALGVMYVLGIVTDRVADRLFGIWANRIRRRYFASDAGYHDARRTILVHAEPMYGLRQYGRSRMRIVRGWAFNAALLVVPFNLWAARSGTGAGVQLVLNGALAALFVGAAWSWKALAHSEYRKIRGGADFVRRERGDGTLEAGRPPAAREVPPLPAAGAHRED